MEKFLGSTTIYRQIFIEKREALLSWRTVSTESELLEAVRSLPKDGYPAFLVIMKMNDCIVGNAEYALLAESAEDSQPRLLIEYECGACQGLSRLLLQHYPLYHEE